MRAFYSNFSHLAHLQFANITQFVAELSALIRKAGFVSETSKTLRAEQEELNDAMFPDESHLFFWLGAPPPPPIV